MTASEKKELVDTLAQNYISEKENDKVWQREKSSGHLLSLGKLLGVCTAFQFDVEETNKTLTIFTRSKRKIITKIILED